jgi:hypothetical protein
MAELPNQLNEKSTWQRVLEQIKSIMEGTLSQEGVIPSHPVKWTKMRWDVPDITASWSDGSQSRNIHLWLKGDWPRLYLELEGAAWEDAGTQRMVQFFPSKRLPTYAVEIRGSALQPNIFVIDQRKLETDLRRLVAEVKNGNPVQAGAP